MQSILIQLRCLLAINLVLIVGAPVGQALAAPASCEVTSAQRLAPGGDSDWSLANDLIAYDQADPSGTYQLRTIRPDGSDDWCLSCAAAPVAPRVDRHKRAPVWHPSGNYLVLQGEMDSHPLSWLRNSLLSELQANGVWMNLYATTPDGSQWWRLTDYARDRTEGGMAPHFSANGSKLLWSHLVETPAGQHAPWGTWRLMMADFVVDADGAPTLQHVEDITPADGGAFFESHGFSPDGGAAIFASDRGTTHDWGMDLWTLDLATGALTNLTHSGHWEEHASYAPDGRTIAYMSSEPYDWAALLFGAFGAPSGTELFLMNADGSNQRQLTHFNVAGFPESDTVRHSMPHRANWSADGTRLALTRQFTGKDYPGRELWMLGLAGPCGQGGAGDA